MFFLVNGNPIALRNGGVVLPRNISYEGPTARGYRFAAVTGEMVTRREPFTAAKRAARAALIVTGNAESGALQSAELEALKALALAATPTAPLVISTDMWSSTITGSFVLDPTSVSPLTQSPLTPDYQWWAWGMALVQI
ncbi:MAG: hypothetical protein ACRC1W_03735 [Shewanella sp.]